MDISGINNNFVNNTIENAKINASDGAFEDRLKAAMEKKDEAELKKVCRDFESIMLGLMLKQMKATVPKTGLFGNDAGKEIFDEMLDEKLMENASESGGIGLGDLLFKQLKRNLTTWEGAPAEAGAEE